MKESPAHQRADAEPTVQRRLLEPGLRASTVGTVGLVSLIAYEAMGNATVMPQAAAELDGISLYGFAFGAPLAAAIVGMVAAGRWADDDSPLRPALTGGACFIAGLLAAAVAPSMAWLLAGRVVTGLGSGMLAVALYALVGRVYAAHLHSRVFAAFSAAWIVPALLAPGVSGAIAQHHGWRWAMLMVATLGVAGLAMLLPIRIARTAPASRAPASRRFLWAVVAATGAMTMHLAGQAHGADGAGAPMPGALRGAVLVLAACAMLAAATRLLPAGTLTARPGLPAAIALSGLSQGAFFAAEAFIPLLLHRQRGMALGAAGFALTAGAVSWTLGAMLRARLHARVPPSTLLRSGLGLLTVGIATSMLVIDPGFPVWLAPVGWTIAGAGMGLVSPTLSIITLALAEGRHGHAGASLRLSAAMTTTSALALSGAAFAVLIAHSANTAFGVSLGLAALLAAAGACLAGRTGHHAPAHGHG